MFCDNCFKGEGYPEYGLYRNQDVTLMLKKPPLSSLCKDCAHARKIDYLVLETAVNRKYYEPKHNHKINEHTANALLNSVIGLSKLVNK